VIAVRVAGRSGMSINANWHVTTSMAASGTVTRVWASSRR
jgi:hypothetical protein